MDGAQSAAAQEVRSARACLDKVFDVPKATRRADYRRKALLVTFRAIRKVTRSAMEWHRKTPWMASIEDTPEQQARRTSQKNKPPREQQDKPAKAKTSHPKAKKPKK